MIHDGSRPDVPEKVISDSIRVCREHGNAVAAIDTKEAMLQTEDKIQSTVSIDREILYRTQTPHTMRLGDMMDLHREAEEKGITGSVATCTLLIECGYRVWFSKGLDLNFKITSEEDLMIFRALVAVMDKLNLTEDEA